eukprot:scaffold2234_cov151-Cylindrotheca_fusiformis.AAC.6
MRFKTRNHELSERLCFQKGQSTDWRTCICFLPQSKEGHCLFWYYETWQEIISVLRGLISVELPEGLQVIEAYLCDGCSSLPAAKIPSSVIKIGGGAFCRCHSLTSVNLPPELLEIGQYSFREYDSLETLHIPSKVSSLGGGTFLALLSILVMTSPSPLVGSFTPATVVVLWVTTHDFDLAAHLHHSFRAMITCSSQRSGESIE